MNINTTSNLAPAIQEYYNRNLLDRLVPKFVFDLFADRELLPTSESSTQKFRKYNSLAEAMVPVSEDEVPDGGLPHILMWNLIWNNTLTILNTQIK